MTKVTIIHSLLTTEHSLYHLVLVPTQLSFTSMRSVIQTDRQTRLILGQCLRWWLQLRRRRWRRRRPTILRTTNKLTQTDSHSVGSTESVHCSIAQQMQTIEPYRKTNSTRRNNHFYSHSSCSILLLIKLCNDTTDLTSEARYTTNIWSFVDT